MAQRTITPIAEFDKRNYEDQGITFIFDQTAAASKMTLVSLNSEGNIPDSFRPVTHFKIASSAQTENTAGVTKTVGADNFYLSSQM